MTPHPKLTTTIFLSLLLFFSAYRVASQSASNTPPIITGQSSSITIVRNSSLLILLSHLNVKDPDNRFPFGFVLKVLPGDNYSVQGTRIMPVASFLPGVLHVNVKVNDGTNDSPVFKLSIQVIPPNSTPVINGQKEITIPEDSSVVLLLTHLDVSDDDNPNYPTGFLLSILPDTGNTYSIVSQNRIAPKDNLDGFIRVGVKVSDGLNTSEVFNLSILIIPVNDPPEIVFFDTTAVVYDAGNGPLKIAEAFEVRDVDSDYLSMAEIGFRIPTYSAVNDELFVTETSANIKVLFDPAGILFLVGYAPIDEYRQMIQSLHYNYRLTYDGSGNPAEVLSGTRTIYINLRDGPLVSGTLEKQITMETSASLDIPNTFTPNGDLRNDTWQIRTVNKDQLDDAVIRVYNKKGHLLFETLGFEKAWDGISNGETLPADTYYYIIDLRLSYMKQTYKGSVTILH